MSNTRRSERKEQREWRDLQTEKLAFIKRVQQEEEAEKLAKRYQLVPGEAHDIFEDSEYDDYKYRYPHDDDDEPVPF